MFLTNDEDASTGLRRDNTTPSPAQPGPSPRGKYHYSLSKRHLNPTLIRCEYPGILVKVFPPPSFLTFRLLHHPVVSISHESAREIVHFVFYYTTWCNRHVRRSVLCELFIFMTQSIFSLKRIYVCIVISISIYNNCIVKCVLDDLRDRAIRTEVTSSNSGVGI